MLKNCQLNSKKKHKVDHPSNPYWQFKEAFPKLAANEGTYIQKVKGEYFPDVYSKPWRKYGHHAVKVHNENQISILREDTKEIYRLTKCEPTVGDSNLLYTSYNAFDEPYYVFPAQDNRGVFLRVTIESIGREYIHVVVNGKKDQWRKSNLRNFWQIFTITKY